MEGDGHVLQRASPVRTLLPTSAVVSDHSCHSNREAIDCYKRVLTQFPSDIDTHLVIADLHDSLDEKTASCTYHAKIISLSDRASKPVIDYARSLIYVAEYHLFSGATGTNVGLAVEYLTKVRDSNSELGANAGEMLRKAQLVGRIPASR